MSPKRQDSVAILQRPTYPLAPSQVRRFRRDGHVFLPQLLPAEALAPFRDAIVATANAHVAETRALGERDTYGKAFLQIFNLWTLDDTVRRFVLAPRFAAVAARLLGVHALRLYHDQALFKEPGGGITPWHQDQHYWPLDGSDHHLVDAAGGRRREHGHDAVRLRRARRGAYRPRRHLRRIAGVLRELRGKGGFPISRERTARAGDASFHAGWAPHRAPPNTSTTRRDVMTVIYYADGARVSDPVRPEARGDLCAWLGDLPPGAPAVTRLNPLVWPVKETPCAKDSIAAPAGKRSARMRERRPG